MQTIVRIPAALRTLTGGADEVSGDGAAVGDVLDDLETRHPGLKERLIDEKGVRRFINIYVGDEDVRFTGGLKTEFKAGDQISIIPAIAGGSSSYTPMESLLQRGRWRGLKDRTIKKRISRATQESWKEYLRARNAHDRWLLPAEEAFIPRKIRRTLPSGTRFT